jgi:hypothetical protein
MKRALFAAVLLSLMLVVPAFAVESASPKGSGPSFEEKKAQILKHIDERSAKLQQEKTCIGAAKDDNDLKACREKFGPPRGVFGPGGSAGPIAPAGRPPKVPPPE